MRAPALDLGAWIVWRAEGLVIVDKPAGVLSQPGADGPNLVDLARTYFGESGIGVLHRLDRNVSGLVMLATRKDAARAMSEAFARGEVDRRYAAIVRGSPSTQALAIDAWLDKDETRNVVRARDAAALTEAERGAFVHARTEITVEARFSALFGRGAAVEARPITGRSHQIRVHLAHVGLPIVGDPKYGVRVRGLDRPLLHARTMRFRPPDAQEEVVVTAREPWSLPEVRALRPMGTTNKTGHGSRSRR
ncbi:MAG: RluA family pseudouridine synthase [Sandaracinus sp.]